MILSSFFVQILGCEENSWRRANEILLSSKRGAEHFWETFRASFLILFLNFATFHDFVSNSLTPHTQAAMHLQSPHGLAGSATPDGLRRCSRKLEELLLTFPLDSHVLTLASMVVVLEFGALRSIGVDYDLQSIGHLQNRKP